MPTNKENTITPENMAIINTLISNVPDAQVSTAVESWLRSWVRAYPDFFKGLHTTKELEETKNQSVAGMAKFLNQALEEKEAIKKQLEEAKGRGGTHRWVKCKDCEGLGFFEHEIESRGICKEVKCDTCGGQKGWFEEIPSTEKLFTEEEMRAHGKECAELGYSECASDWIGSASAPTKEEYENSKKQFLSSLPCATKKDN